MIGRVNSLPFLYAKTGSKRKWNFRFRLLV